jgi:hypothetical protein
MALGAVVGRFEPQDHPEQSHGIHLILPSLRRGGRPGVRVAQSQGL